VTQAVSQTCELKRSVNQNRHATSSTHRYQSIPSRARASSPSHGGLLNTDQAKTGVAFLLTYSQ
jgi:hypothetical protein